MMVASSVRPSLSGPNWDAKTATGLGTRLQLRVTFLTKLKNGMAVENCWLLKAELP